jgi:p-hydroxybenzoate 3-monooxygenase
MTTMLHKHPSGDSFEERLATAQLEWVASAPAMATALAQNYTGLPYGQDWSYR